MKQHITVEQMKEIEDKTLAKYMGLHFTHLLESACYYGAEKPLGRDKLNKMAEMVTIGKMKEIIKKSSYKKIKICKQDLDSIVNQKPSNIKEFYGETTCDALWEAVKYVLEEE